MKKLRIGIYILLIGIIVFAIGIFIFKKSSPNVTDTLKQTVSTPFIIASKDDEVSYFSNNKYVKEYKENRRKQIIDNNIIYYAKYFNLDTQRVVKLARDLTNDYTSEEFLNDHSIRKEDGKFASLEMGIIHFVRYLYRNPANYGVDNSIITSYNVDKVKNRVDGHIRLSNGMTFEQFFARICDVYGINKVFALAIVYEESGIMTSFLFNNKNNMAGLRANVEYFSFPTLEAGTIVYVLTLKNLLARTGVDSFDINQVYTFSGLYVHGNSAEPAEHWTQNVTRYMRQIEEKKVFEIG